MLLLKRASDVDIYEKLFVKMARLGFPDEFEGYKMIYYFRDYQTDIQFVGSCVKKIEKMWELLK